MSKLEDGFVDDSNFKQLWNEMHSDLLKNDFYGQILLIADKRWSGQKVEEIDFSASYPRFSVINKQQFRFYLYYRTQMLDLNYIMPTHISYIYMFMYEILTGAENTGINTINSILNYLTDNLGKYYTSNLYGGQGDYALTSKIEKWKKNINRVYEYKNRGIQPAGIETITFDKFDLKLWENVSKYNIYENEFINEYNLLDSVNAVLKNIILKLENKYEDQGVDIVYFCVGNLQKKLDYESFFATSVWTNSAMKRFLPMECAMIKWNETHSEQVDVIDDYGNTIRRVNTKIKEIEFKLALYVLKSIEYYFRLNTDYKSKLRKPKIDVSKSGIEGGYGKYKFRYFSSDMKKRQEQYEIIKNIPDILKIVDETVENYIGENEYLFNNIQDKTVSIQSERKIEIEDVASQEIELACIDEKSLDDARNVLYKNQKRLIVEDIDVIAQSNSVKVIDEANDGLSRLEKELLRTLMYNSDIKEFEAKAHEEFTSLNMLIESINNKAIDEIGDYVIENDGNIISLVKDYYAICEKWVI